MAFVAIASRLVGATFRCLETFNPKLKDSSVGTDSKTVCIRELGSLVMSFFFSLATNKLLAPKWKWGDFKLQMFTSIIGTGIAETIGRLVAYRKLYLHKQPHNLSQPSRMANTLASVGPTPMVSQFTPMTMPVASLNRASVPLSSSYSYASARFSGWRPGRLA